MLPLGKNIFLGLTLGLALIQSPLVSGANATGQSAVYRLFACFSKLTPEEMNYLSANSENIFKELIVSTGPNPLTRKQFKQMITSLKSQLYPRTAKAKPTNVSIKSNSSESHPEPPAASDKQNRTRRDASDNERNSQMTKDLNTATGEHNSGSTSSSTTTKPLLPLGKLRDELLAASNHRRYQKKRSVSFDSDDHVPLYDDESDSDESDSDEDDSAESNERMKIYRRVFTAQLDQLTNDEKEDLMVDYYRITRKPNETSYTSERP